MKANTKSSFMIIALVIANSMCEQPAKRALQESHEKPRIEKFMEKFLLKQQFEPYSTMVDLLILIFNNYLYNCIPILLYDNEKQHYIVLEGLLKKLNTTLIHGLVFNHDSNIRTKFPTRTPESHCFSYILLVNDVLSSKYIMGKQNTNKIVVITKSSQWKVNEFLSSESSRNLINLLIISPSNINLFKENEPYYILYTHDLFIDGLGGSTPKILTAWRNGALTRPKVNLFSPKIENGFSGHRFLTSVAHEPPFVIKKGLDDNDEIIWDGIEIKLLKLLSTLYNFTLDIKSTQINFSKSSSDKIIDNINDGMANVGLSGIYVTAERLNKVDVSYPHSYDCAAFISLASTALPRYRAIMGPFHWTVWLILAITYLLAIFPLTFAEKLTLRHLFLKPQEIENMFWHVFGTFTNCFIFGTKTWTKSTRITPRILMGFYWVFTIIITACYTGSIIAFITVPLYPVAVDTVNQLLSGRYQIGTLDKGGWEFWFQNSTDISLQKLFKHLELLPDIQSGLKNITSAFFWPYAFLGPRAQLDFTVQTNFTTRNRKSLLHISSQCFMLFGVSAAFEKNSIYKDIIDRGISYVQQSGFMIKFEHDIKWDYMRGSTGKLLKKNTENNFRSLIIRDRSLTLDDTQGIFLLLGAGFLVGTYALAMEFLGGYCNCCKKMRISRTSSISTNTMPCDTLTSQGKLDSVGYRFREFPLINMAHEYFENINTDDVNQYNLANKNIKREIRSTEDITVCKKSRFCKNYHFDKLFGGKN